MPQEEPEAHPEKRRQPGREGIARIEDLEMRVSIERNPQGKKDAKEHCSRRHCRHQQHRGAVAAEVAAPNGAQSERE